MKKYLIGVALCLVVVFTMVGFAGCYKARTDERIDTLEEDVTALQTHGFITEAEANALIQAAVSGKLTETQVKSLINAAIGGFLKEDQVLALIDAAMADKLSEDEVSSLISAAVSGLLSENEVTSLINNALNALLGTAPAIEIEDVAWMTMTKREEGRPQQGRRNYGRTTTIRYINVGFSFDWSSFEHIDSIVVTVYNDETIIGKASTTGMKLALALALDGFDYEMVREKGQLTCPVGLEDNYWKQEVFAEGVCTFTSIVIQINADHKAYGAVTFNKGGTLHFYDEGIKTKSTCTEQGFTTYTCEQCGEVVIDNYKDALGHNYNIFKETVDPTCKHEVGGPAQGYTTYNCSNDCGTTENREFTDAYTGYKPGCADCLAEKKAAARAEFDEFCKPYLQGYLDANDYANLTKFSSVADKFTIELENAATLDEVDKVLEKAKTRFLLIKRIIMGEEQDLENLFTNNGSANNSFDVQADGSLNILNDFKRNGQDTPYGSFAYINETLTEVNCGVDATNGLQDGEFFVIIMGIEATGYWSNQFAVGFANVGGQLYMNFMYGGIKWTDDLNGTALNSHLGQISNVANGAVAINDIGDITIVFDTNGGVTITVDGQDLVDAAIPYGIVNAFWILGNAEVTLSSLVMA